MKTDERLTSSFRQQIDLHRGLGQVALLKLVIEHFAADKKTPRPCAVWPPQTERRDSSA